jgi:hypothetical protein
VYAYSPVAGQHNTIGDGAAPEIFNGGRVELLGRQEMENLVARPKPAGRAKLYKVLGEHG